MTCSVGRSLGPSSMRRRLWTICSTHLRDSGRGFSDLKDAFRCAYMDGKVYGCLMMFMLHQFHAFWDADGHGISTKKEDTQTDTTTHVANVA